MNTSARVTVKYILIANGDSNTEDNNSCYPMSFVLIVLNEKTLAAEVTYCAFKEWRNWWRS